MALTVRAAVVNVEATQRVKWELITACERRSLPMLDDLANPAKISGDKMNQWKLSQSVITLAMRVLQEYHKEFGHLLTKVEREAMGMK